MRISITLMRPLILALFIFNAACGGGGPGGDLSPDPTTPNVRTQSKASSGSNQKQPSKPKINQDAKQLFILAGQVANKPNPDYDRALTLYSEAYEKDKKLTMALYNAGLVSELKGDETQARQFYEAAGSAGVGDGWVNLALMALNTGDKGQAESLFNRALSVEPLNGSAHLNLAMFAKERRDFEFAMKSVRNALKDDSTNANAYDVLAQIYYDLGRYKLALLVADAGLSELDPDHTGLWTTQGLIQLRMDDVIKAVRSFQKAVDLDPNNFAARLNLGLVTFNYRDYEKSYQLLSEAVKLRPNSVEAVISHAVAARTLKRYDEARSGYNKVLELAPNHPGALFNIAVLDQDYVEIDPNDFDRRAQITQTAIDQYQRVINSTQSKTLRKKAQLRIEEAKVIIEAIDAEKEAAAAEAEAAVQEASQPTPEAAPVQ
jgi:tetratricopeptide (TPR) repeat protein